jgi:FkbM family methyltransferase
MIVWVRGTWLTVQTEARAFARRTGVMPLIRRFTTRTEDKFHAALRGAIRPGDVVWDVGANLGVYTEVFADWVGSSGTVVAFEPVPSCFREMERRLGSRDNVIRLECGLGDTDGDLPMMVDDHPLAGTHSFAGGSGTAVQLKVHRGDTVVSDDSAPAPNVVKIDVEGFEQEVLDGLGAILRDPSCRAILCEVHFTVLDQRGRRQAPREIEALLKASGYRTRWVDSSHIAGERDGG